MRRMLALALATAAVTAPAAVATNEAHTASHGATRPVVTYVFRGVVVGSPTGQMVTIDQARGVNRHARRALDGATSFTLRLSGATKLVRAGQGNVALTALTAGDRVKIRIRARKGTPLAALPAARMIIACPGQAAAPPPAPTPAPVPPPPPTQPGPIALPL